MGARDAIPPRCVACGRFVGPSGVCDHGGPRFRVGRCLKCGRPQARRRRPCCPVTMADMAEAARSVRKALEEVR